MESTLRVSPESLREEPQPLKSRFLSYLIVFLLIGATLAVFRPVGAFEFVNYDDDRYVATNPYLLKGFSLEGIRWAFSADLAYDSPYVDYWQPVTLISRMMDVRLHGLNPGGHHSTNLFLHVVNAVLLFDLLWGMTGALWRSVLVAALFALHPLQVEPVAWVTARKDLLSVFFGLLTIQAYRSSLRKFSWGRSLSVIFLFLLSLMSKPALLALPFLLLLLDFWPLRKFLFEIRAGLFRKLPLFLLSIFFAAIPLITQGGVFRYAPTQAIISNALVRTLVYLKKIFAPISLAIYRPLPTAGFSLGQVIAAGVILAAISVFAARSIKRRPYFFVGWFWYLGMLVPALGLIQAEDRFMYFPVVGVFLCLVWGLSDLVSRFRFGKIAAAFSTVGIFLALTPVTLAQVRYWENSLTLFERSLAVKPENYLAHNQLCAAWLDRGNSGKAIRFCEQALKINPNLPEAHYNFGVALVREGKLDEASRHYTEALQLRPGYFQAHANLGTLLAQQGKFDEALGHYQQALELRPESAETHNNLANTLLQLRSIDRAIKHYREAIRLQPEAGYLHRNLATALVQQGERREARQHFLQARNLKRKK